MTSQAIQGWHPNPQLMQPPQQAPPPQGWTGSWPPGGNVAFPPGYPGPPPMPGGAVAHASWNAGFWKYNPLANMQNPQQPWAPGVGWFPPNYNPYKRVPKPPSPSYWNTKLSDNGLGLEGMVKRKDPSEYNGEEPRTPWIWNPPSLLEAGERATPTRDFNPRRTASVDNVSTPTPEHVQSSRGSLQESSTVQAHNHTPERRPASRANYFYSTQESSVAHTTPARHSSDPSDIRPSRSASALAGPPTSNQRSISHSDSWPTRSRSQPPVANEVPPYPAPTPILHNRPGSTSQTSLTQEPETFTSRGELHPTFSSNIIRTPTYYQQARRSTDELPSSYHLRSPPSSTPARGPPAPDPLTRQSSLPNTSSTRDVYANFSEDLSNSLIASTSSRTRSSAAGPLSRSRTEPVVANLTTIPESSSSLSSGELFLRPLRDTPYVSSNESSPDPSPRRKDRDRDRSRDRDKRTSPHGSGSHPHSPDPSPGMYRDRRPSPYAARHAHAQSHSRSHSPSPLASPHDPYGIQGGSGGTSVPRRENSNNNPLPPPPIERASLEASRPPVQEPSPPHYAHKVRMGFWNRRGDHLTPNSYVVYAPHDRAYPEELRDYPDERNGYRDEFGSFVAWRQERPELPGSLPYHGRPPTQPYESFVVYTYLQ